MPSDWIQFCKKYASDNNIKYCDALKKCSALYNKKGKVPEVKEIEQPQPTSEDKPRRRRRKKEIVEPI
jgi:hypothetical protein